MSRFISNLPYFQSDRKGTVYIKFSQGKFSIFVSFFSKKWFKFYFSSLVQKIQNIILTLLQKTVYVFGQLSKSNGLGIQNRCYF